MATTPEDFYKAYSEHVKNADKNQVISFVKEVKTILKDTKEDLEKKTTRLEEKLPEIKEGKREFCFQIDPKKFSVNEREKAAKEFATNLINFDSQVKVYQEKTIYQIEKEISDNKKQIKMVEEAINYFSNLK
jgi:hypothetical protein